ncbi:hypothetical protein B0H19DRAFT_1201128 [Mycena capillaripes]|nr:hypothetical protein B0H19DRAFT_1201128 [Mycena capillaripes]
MLQGKDKRRVSEHSSSIERNRKEKDKTGNVCDVQQDAERRSPSVNGIRTHTRTRAHVYRRRSTSISPSTLTQYPARPARRSSTRMTAGHAKKRSVHEKMKIGMRKRKRTSS